MQRTSCCLLSVCCAILLIGCGPSGPVTVQVSGNVNVDGKPLKEGFIYFKTIREGSINRLPVSGGSYEGIVEVGERRVEIARYREGRPFMGYTPQVNTVDPQFSSASTLKADVTEDGPNEFDFEATTKKGEKPQ